MTRLATIGTSRITCDLIEAAASVEGVSFTGALSRDEGRARSFTLEYGGSLPFTSLEGLAASGGVDAVYIASPNALHAEQALACIAGGKHVLVEKPFASNRAEAARVFAAAREAGVVAMEGMRPVHDPAYNVIRGALPELGRIRRATLRFGKYSSRYDDIRAGRRTNIFDCAMASGSLMDIGVYCVEPMVDLFGAPAGVSATAVALDRETRGLTNGAIDGAGVLVCAYGRDPRRPEMVATLHHSKISADLSPCQVEGELGTLTFEGASAPTRARLDLRAPAPRDGAKGYLGTRTEARELELPSCGSTMVYELADFASMVEQARAGTPPEDAANGDGAALSHFEGLTLEALAIMDEARRQCGIRFPADE